MSLYSSVKGIKDKFIEKLKGYQGKGYVDDPEDRAALYDGALQLSVAGLRLSRQDRRLKERAHELLGNLSERALYRLHTQLEAAMVAYRASPTPGNRRAMDGIERRIAEATRHLRSDKAGLGPEYKHRLESVAVTSIMFGLMLFSLVLMLSQPKITGFTILNLPVIVNWPFVLGLAIFILDLIAIERWYVSSPQRKPAARSSRRR